VYNLSILGSLILAGYGMFLLVDYLVKSKKIAFLCGFSYAFSPYIYAHLLGTFHMIAISWLPFYILFLFKTVEENKIVNSIFAGVFLFLSSLTDWQYLIYLSLFTLFFILSKFIKKEMSWIIVKKMLILISVYFLLVLPFAIPLIISYFTENYMKTGIEKIFSSVAFINYFLPNPFNTIYGRLVKPLFISSQFSLTESVVSIPYTILFFCTIGIIALWNEWKVRLFFISFLIFLILSLGPKMRIFNHLTFESPFYIFLYRAFPFFNVIREPGRFSVMVLLTSVVLFSYGLKHVLLLKRRKNFIVVLVFIFLFLETISVPITLTNTSVPHILYSLQEDRGNFTILDIPELINPRALYFQTIHNKPILGGYVSRIPPESKEIITLLRIYTKNRNITLIKNILESTSTKYIIFHSYGYGHMSTELMELPSLIPSKEIYRDNTTIVYKVELGTNNL
jgi:hypothetical protein